MKKYLLFIFMLLAACNPHDTYTLSYFNFPLGKDIEKVKKIMASAGYTIILESPTKTGIAFESGKFHGYEVDCILMTMGHHNKLETIHISISKNAAIFYELSMNILQNNLGTPTTVFDIDSHKAHWWQVRDQEITLNLKDQIAVYSITINPETYLYTGK